MKVNMEKRMELVLLNLTNILESKSEIISKATEYVESEIKFVFYLENVTIKTVNHDSIEDLGRFNLKFGLCHNADLWCLNFHDIFGNPSLGAFTKRKSLLNNISEKYLSISGSKDISYPVADRHEDKMRLWLNPDRWKYVQLYR